MNLQTTFEHEITRAGELRKSLFLETQRIEQTLVDYRNRLNLVSKDDDEAEFNAQAAYQRRRENRKPE